MNCRSGILSPCAAINKTLEGIHWPTRRFKKMKDDIRERARQKLQDRIRELGRAIDASGIVERVRAMQAPMVDAARSCFSESELDDLRCVIRLTLEFDDYLKGADKFHDYLKSFDTDRISNNLIYACESIFWGIESFMRVTRAYKVLVGAVDSRIEWGAISTSSLRERFIPMFQEFAAETNFENQCRLLLDLFKLQIVWAAISYD